MSKQQRNKWGVPSQWMPPGPIERKAALVMEHDPIAGESGSDPRDLAAACCSCHGSCHEASSSSNLPSPPAGCFRPKTAPQLGDWLANGQPGEEERQGQDYQAYVKGKRGLKRRKFPSPHSRTTIYLCNIDRARSQGENTTKAMELFRSFVEAFFGMNCRVVKPFTDTERSKLQIRREIPLLPQYSTPSIHKLLKRRKGKLKDAFCIMGITMVDLYPGEYGWNFVFGEASMDNGTGVFSMARYDARFEQRWNSVFEDHQGGHAGIANNLSDDSIEAFPPWPNLVTDGTTLFWRRSFKTLCHELGHLFHMEHCVYYQCIMNGCKTMEEQDSSPLHFCPVCLRKLYYAVAVRGKQPGGFDMVNRYQAIVSFFSNGWMTDNGTSLLQFRNELNWFDGAVQRCSFAMDDSSGSGWCPCQTETAEAEDDHNNAETPRRPKNLFGALLSEDEDDEAESTPSPKGDGQGKEIRCA